MRFLLIFMLIGSTAWADSQNDCERRLQSEVARHGITSPREQINEVDRLKMEIQREFKVELILMLKGWPGVSATIENDEVVDLHVPADLRGEELRIQLVGIQDHLRKVKWLREKGIDLELVKITATELKLSVKGFREVAGDSDAEKLKLVRWLTKRYNLKFNFDRNLFTGKFREASGLSTQETIHFPPAAIGKIQRSTVAHELVHVIHSAQRDSGKLIWFYPEPGKQFPNLSDAYNEGFRSDEVEAWYVSWLINRRPSEMKSVAEFLRQARWLRALAERMERDQLEQFRLQRRIPSPAESSLVLAGTDSIRTFEVTVDNETVRIMIPVKAGERPVDIVKKRLRQLLDFSLARAGVKTVKPSSAAAG